jgi:DNA-binding CsgD family transcriptional regulator/PAS domain-containing protein
MASDTQRSAAIGAVYGSLLWPDGWAPALREMESLFRADHMFLSVEGQPTLSGMVGIAPSDIAGLGDAIPVFAQVVKASVGNGQVAQWQDIYRDRSAYERSGIFQDLVRPLGGYHGLIVVDDSSMIGLAVCRGPSRNDYDEQTRQELSTLYPHLRMAREIADRFGIVQESNQSLARLIARMPDAVILTDASGRVIMMNDAAHRSAIAAYAEGDLIAAATPESTFALRAAIAQAAADTDIGGRWLALAGSQDAPAHFARILAFAPGRFGLLDAGPARVAVFIKDAVSPRNIDRTALFDLFRLTPREADVTCMLLDGHTAQEIAAILGLSMPTVRTHLARIFEKTGTRNQATLIALVSRFHI